MLRFLISVAVAWIAWPAWGEKPADVPRLESTPCSSFDLHDENAECGFLIVPENRDDPESRTLRLAVAILKSRSAEPQPDPVIYLHGGPGGSAIADASGWLDHPLRDDRDFILLDQRVTGFSEPELCPELSKDDMTVMARDLSAEEATAERLALSLACRDELLSEGVDLASYNSDASSADLSDLRRVLGYDSWNVYGISYGTKLALTTMRNAPEGIRSVVLDSAYPPGVQAFDHRAAGVIVDPDKWVRQGQTEPSSLVAHQNPEFVVQPRWWAAEEEVRKALQGRGGPAYLCYKDVTSPTNQRTMIAAFLPHVAVVNSAPLVLCDEAITPRLQGCLLANLNAFVQCTIGQMATFSVHTVKRVKIGRGWARKGLWLVIPYVVPGINQVAEGYCVSFEAPDGETGKDAVYALHMQTQEDAQTLSRLVENKSRVPAPAAA